MADTRSRMVDAALSSLQHDGVAGMSFTEVLRESGAARGAIYHHFPGGKAQLVTEAAERHAEDVRAVLSALPGTRPAAVVKAFLDEVRPVVVASAHGGGCAIAAISVGTPGELTETAARVFALWTDALTDRLESAGLRRKDAADLATTLLILLEGAHVLCRAAGSLEPFEQAANQALKLAN